MNREEQEAGFDEQRISKLIGTLKHVDAPGTFDTRVRSRIASRRTNAPGKSWRPLVIGIATAVVVGGAGLVGFRTLSPESEVSTTPVNTPAVSAPIPTPFVEVAPQPTQEAPLAASPTLAAQKQPKGKVNTPVKTGGSVDQALKDVQSFDPRAPRQPNGYFSVGSLLNTLGVDATWNGSGWQIGSVKQHSVADRSTLRAGDVVEAIDGKTLLNDTKLTSITDGRSLRVRRAGATVELPLRP